MTRTYSVQFDGVSVSASQDLFEIVPADDVPIKLLGLFLSQSSDVGDAAEEMARIRIIRGFATSGSGGSAGSPVPIDSSGASAVHTAEMNNLDGAIAGASAVLHSEAFNIRSGFAMWWTPETAPRISQADSRVVVRLSASPADALSMSGTIYIQEG